LLLNEVICREAGTTAEHNSEKSELSDITLDRYKPKHSSEYTEKYYM
jgi:hypothetical protein